MRDDGSSKSGPGQTEEQFHILVDSVEEYAIYMLDSTGNVLTWNSGAERIKQYKAEEIIGKNFACFYTAEDVAAAFDYELRVPNEWAGVNMEVFGEPEKDGKLVPDDVSDYKFITLRVFVKGEARYIRLELISRGQGANLESGYPLASFRLSPGFNTYKLKLDSFNQPDWAMPLDLKRDVLKKLTSVTIGVHCDKCVMDKGTVVVDNIAFEK